ncbi:MAG: YbaB/EbfC family nucleoid-associated protein [Saprospiraceae bacterium]
MFGDMFGDLEKKQQEMRSKLSEIRVEAEAGEGAVKVVANANREIVNISINKDALDWDDVEQVEDFVTVAVNRALEKAAEKEAEAAQKLMQDMMPPGMGDLSGLFG